MHSQAVGTSHHGNMIHTSHATRASFQTCLDAFLHSEFEENKENFDYCTTIDANVSNLEGSIPSSTISSYLQTVQRGRLIQPFGCLIAVNEQTFSVIAYSENASDMLGLTSSALPRTDHPERLRIGSDALMLFRPSSCSAIQKAVSCADISLMNPILVHCRHVEKSFYAILHRVDIGLVIELEPTNASFVPDGPSGVLKSYQLAAKAISRLQSLPSGNVLLLCDVLVQELRDLTGYDRVMAYKFHKDEHGEVIAECKRPDLEGYLGLHYPATDVPQVARFLFMKNKVRMICDCSATPVMIIQDEQLVQPLILGGSQLRAPHRCHAQYMVNMGSIASLVMSVTLGEHGEEMGGKQKGRRLWGLVVCHHTSSRFVPFTLRKACEFLIQVFSLQLNKEVELAAQMREKHVIHIKSMLCDMLLRDAPLGIMVGSPNVMDLVKSDGAGLYYNDQCWLLGATPKESHVRDIAKWLLQSNSNAIGLSTDSLVEAGCPGALDLGDAVCGMVAVRFTDRDFLFWFRSSTEKEVKWGGAKHDSMDEDGDGRKMHPRSSFMAFLEVVKFRSLPWTDIEIDAIHSLQMILRSSLQKKLVEDLNMTMAAPAFDESRIQKINELCTITSELLRLIDAATVPILAVDTAGNVNGWNNKVAELTGLPVEKALGTPLISLVDKESIGVVKDMLLFALKGKNITDIEIKLKTFRQQSTNGSVMLDVTTCCHRDAAENVVGVTLVAQDLTAEKSIMDKYTSIQGDYNTIILNPSGLIPPIFIINKFGNCIEWNSAMHKLTGLERDEAIDKVLVGEIFGFDDSPCQVDHGMLTQLGIVLNGVVSGEETSKLLFEFCNQSRKYIESLLSASKRTDSDGQIVGAVCFLHVTSPELKYALKMQKLSEHMVRTTTNRLAYIRQGMQNPLHGSMFIHGLMEAQELRKEQRQFLKLSSLCAEQLAKVIKDTDLQRIEDIYLDMCIAEVSVAEILEAVTIQAMPLSREREVTLVHDLPPEVSTLCLYADKLRLQQVLSNFLVCTVQFTSAEGLVVLRLFWRTKRIGTRVEVAHLEICIIHPSPGIPEALVQEMFHLREVSSKEGLGLCISHKIVKSMDGTVQYLREAERSSLIVLLELPVSCPVRSR